MTEAEWLTSEDPGAMLRLLDGEVTWRADQPKPVIVKPSARRLRLFACSCCRQVWHLLTDDYPCRCSDEGARTCPNCEGAGRVNRSRRAVETAERFADGLATEEELEAAAESSWLVAGDALGSAAVLAAHACTYRPMHTRTPNAWHAAQGAGASPATQAALLREVVGNPFRVVAFDPAWRTPDVLALGQAAYDERPGRGCAGCKGSGETDWWGDDDMRTDHKCPDCGGTGRIDDGTLDPVRLGILSDALEEAGCTDDAILRHLRGRDVAGWEGISRTVRPTGPHVRGCWCLDAILGRA